MKKKPTEWKISLTPTDGCDPNRIVRFTFTIRFKGTPTERKKKMVAELFTTNFFRFLPAQFAEKYEWAYYENLLHSEKKRRAMKFLRMWNYHLASAREDGRAVTGRKFLAPLEPLLDALEKGDAVFFSGLSEAMRILQRSDLDKWLFDYAIENCWEKKHTPRELNEQFVSKFRDIKDKKLHEKLHKLGIPHKDELRGKASPNYNALLNLPPHRRKTG